MKSICCAAVAQWRKRLTRKGYTRVQNWKGAYFNITYDVIETIELFFI